jgi:hypothetical protein
VKPLTKDIESILNLLYKVFLECGNHITTFFIASSRPPAISRAGMMHSIFPSKSLWSVPSLSSQYSGYWVENPRFRVVLCVFAFRLVSKQEVCKSRERLRKKVQKGGY